jgi:hypothetical protein
MIGDDYKKKCKVSFLCLFGGTEKIRFQLSKQTRLERSSSGGIDGSKRFLLFFGVAISEVRHLQ